MPAKKAKAAPACKKAAAPPSSPAKAEPVVTKEVRAAVKKIVRDHFKSKSDVELYGMVIDDKTLWGRLEHDKALWSAKDEDAPVMGAPYYERLRQQYSQTTSPMDELQIDRAAAKRDGPPRDSIMKAVGMVQMPHPNRSLLRQTLLGLKDMTQQEFVLVLRLLYTQRASSSNDALNLILKVGEFITTEGLGARFPTEVRLAKTVFDTSLVVEGALVALLKRSRPSETPTRIFQTDQCSKWPSCKND